MARPPKGKPLTLRPIRLDDDVWAECQRLRGAYGTINELLAASLAALRIQTAQGRVMAETGDPWKTISVRGIATTIPPCTEPCDHLSCDMQRESSKPKARQVQTWKRGPRPKGDKTR